MFSKATRVVAVMLLLCGLLGVVTASAWPPDTPPELAKKMDEVVSRIVAGLKQGIYPFSTESVELGTGNKAFMTSQQFTPMQGLAALEAGFPIARFSTEQGILISNVTIPAGDYYWVMWVADIGFERFGMKFPERLPLLLFIRPRGIPSDGFEAVDFAIPSTVEIEVPNRNPDKLEGCRSLDDGSVWPPLSIFGLGTVKFTPILRHSLPFNGIPSTGAIFPPDLTVRHLSVTARKFSSPCTAPPCPAWWDILALATIANISQVDLTESFTVRVLLNGQLIQEEEVAGLAKGASQPILAATMVDKPGIYIVTVIVDPDNKINERDEMNNIAERSINLQ